MDYPNGIRVATFNGLSSSVAGSYVLEAFDGSLTPTYSTEFSVTIAYQYHLIFFEQPVNTTEGVAMDNFILVEDVDQFGDVNINDHSNIGLSIASGLDGSLFYSESAYNGAAEFMNVTLSAPGTYTLEASNGVVPSATSNAFMVFATSQTSPTMLAFGQQPTSITAGGSISPNVTVKVENQSGSLITTDNSDVTLGIASGGPLSALLGTVTVQAQNGVATFGNLSMDLAGTYSLVAADGSDAPAISQNFTVSAGTPSSISFFEQPANTQVDSIDAVAVAVQDQYGNTIPVADNSVSLSLSGSPGGGALNNVGDSYVSFVNGYTYFPELSETLPGTQTLVASYGSLNVTSNPFLIGSSVYVSTFVGAAGSGVEPGEGLVMDSSGNLWGTTLYGGTYDDGTIYEVITSTGEINTVASFNGDTTGGNPTCKLAIDANGNLYGTTEWGGPNGNGTVLSWPRGAPTLRFW
jgi:uncharacterized repeat protein (TIGR03803 family)